MKNNLQSLNYFMKFLNFKNIINSIIIFIISSACLASARTYVVPPSSKTSTNVPYISDAAMVQCVSLYNKAKWLAEDIDSTYVDQYSQQSVDAYNEKVRKHTQLTQIFNRDCAGKQSESAYKAAQALNKASKKVK